MGTAAKSRSYFHLHITYTRGGQLTLASPYTGLQRCFLASFGPHFRLGYIQRGGEDICFCNARMYARFFLDTRYLALLVGLDVCAIFDTIVYFLPLDAWGF